MPRNGAKETGILEGKKKEERKLPQIAYLQETEPTFDSDCATTGTSFEVALKLDIVAEMQQPDGRFGGLN